MDYYKYPLTTYLFHPMFQPGKKESLILRSELRFNYRKHLEDRKSNRGGKRLFHFPAGTLFFIQKRISYPKWRYLPL